MRTQSDIEDRIRYLLVKELERRVRKAAERLPHRCVYNHRQPVDVRKTVEDEPNPYYNRITMGVGPGGEPVPVHQTIGLCMYGAENVETVALTICEDPVDAQRCPLFVPRKSKEMLWKEFGEQLADPVWIQGYLPEVYGLLWTLDTERLPHVPWWARLLYRLLRIRPEPVRATTDLVKLLPPVS